MEDGAATQAGHGAQQDEDQGEPGDVLGVLAVTAQLDVLVAVGVQFVF